MRYAGSKDQKHWVWNFLYIFLASRTLTISLASEEDSFLLLFLPPFLPILEK